MQQTNSERSKSMSREISLFSDYHQKENRVTNYVGLALKLIYQESPEQFQEWLASFLPDDNPLIVGPVFTQQSAQDNGVPDLCICQQSFSIFVETKLHNWHDSGQLNRHLKDLGDMGHRILLALANFEIDNPESSHPVITKAAKEAGISVIFLSFEDLLQEWRELKLSTHLEHVIKELERFLDSSGLLPVWKSLLTVVNCGNTINELTEIQSYVCPNTGGAYSHRRAKYIGLYTGNKTVTKIGEIEARVSCGPGFTDPQADWFCCENDSSRGDLEREYIKRAESLVSLLAPDHSNNLRETGVQFFLIKPNTLRPTAFKKGSRGGLLGSKRYFSNIAQKVEAGDSATLAERLKGKTWEELGF